MFHINYETAKAEVSRRHERLAAAQRSGLAYERPARSQFAPFARVRSWFARANTPAESPASAAPGEPCITC